MSRARKKMKRNITLSAVPRTWSFLIKVNLGLLVEMSKDEIYTTHALLFHTVRQKIVFLEHFQVVFKNALGGFYTHFKYCFHQYKGQGPVFFIV